LSNGHRCRIVTIIKRCNRIFRKKLNNEKPLKYNLAHAHFQKWLALDKTDGIDNCRKRLNISDFKLTRRERQRQRVAKKP